ncbi:MAG: two-component system nitrogen regulation response regulator GlnG [Oceanicoccus sp.]
MHKPIGLHDIRSIYSATKIIGIKHGAEIMNQQHTVWVVDDDRSIRWVLEKALNQANIGIHTFNNGESLLDALKTSAPDSIISDIRMPGIDGFELLSKIGESHPDLPVIITTAHSDLDSAVASYQGGAFEYLPKPFDIDEAVAVTKRALLHADQNRQPIVNTNHEESGSTEIIGEAPAMQEVFRAIGRLSHSNITVLINGESGTGKELVAQALHRHSPRDKEQFIALNMAAIPKELMESELFGHEKGAFTGATSLRTGRFEQANNGTLFLDEIGDMPAETQTRLLRVLADGEFYRVGGHIPVKVNVRIIAATHQNLEQLVTENRFREDLFHRLNVIRVHIPSLRNRREDIPKLMQYFFQKSGDELDTETKILTKETENYLCTLDWPGNVRQLENTCRWITVMASGREIHIDDLPPELVNKPTDQNPQLATDGNWQNDLKRWTEQELALGRKNILDTAVPVFETIMIESALKHTNGRKRDAAVLLGWGRNTLTRKINELKLYASDGDDDA